MRPRYSVPAPSARALLFSQENPSGESIELKTELQNPKHNAEPPFENIPLETNTPIESSPLAKKHKRCCW